MPFPSFRQPRSQGPLLPVSLSLKRTGRRVPWERGWVALSLFSKASPIAKRLLWYLILISTWMKTGIHKKDFRRNSPWRRDCGNSEMIYWHPFLNFDATTTNASNQVSLQCWIQVLIDLIDWFTLNDSIHFPVNLPKHWKRDNLTKKLTRWTYQRVFCSLVCLRPELGTTLRLTLKWNDFTYIIPNTDHQMLLNLRASQTEPTWTFQRC